MHATHRSAGLREEKNRCQYKNGEQQLIRSVAGPARGRSVKSGPATPVNFASQLLEGMARMSLQRREWSPVCKPYQIVGI
jgi:hypothetical protein